MLSIVGEITQLEIDFYVMSKIQLAMSFSQSLLIE